MRIPIAVRGVLSPTAQATIGGLLWTRQFGTAASASANAVASDASGGYVAGGVLGALPGQTSAGGTDAFLLKYDANGTLLWTHQFGTANWDVAEAVATDASGIYVAGMASGILPGPNNTGGGDVFVRKYDVNGSLLWTRQFGTTSGDNAWALATDDSGAYVAGDVGGALPGQTSAGGADAYVQKYKSDGTLLWTRQFGTTSDDVATALATDASGVYVGGLTNGAFAGQTSSGSSDAFLLKYESNGTLVWTHQFGTAAIDNLNALATDASGVYAAGATYGALPGQTNLGDTDAFLLKYDADGTLLWTNEFGTTAHDWADALATNASGVYVAGFTGGTLPGPNSTGSGDVFVRKYHVNGTLVWTHQFGVKTGDIAYGIATQATEVYVGGDMGSGAFVARMAEVPGPPGGLGAVPGSSNVTLTWSTPSFDGGAPVVEYRVFRGNASGAETLLTSVGPVRTYVDTNLTSGVTYYYEVVAVNAIGAGSSSNEAAATASAAGTVTPPWQPLSGWVLAAVLSAVVIVGIGTWLWILARRRRRRDQSEEPAGPKRPPE